MSMQYAMAFYAFLLCVVTTPLVRKLAVKRNWMAHPSDERWHKKPTALFGGIAIYIAISLPLFTLSDFFSLYSHAFLRIQTGRLPSITALIWMGMTFLFLLGLLDDFFQIKPQSKLVGQILAASFVAFLGFRLHWFTSMTLDTLVTIFWIVGITNAFNLLDNMDGLCAGVGAVSAVYLAILLAGQAPQAAWVALILAGALGGFLIYNFNPASIFMGDCGSLVIGFVLSVLSLSFSEFAASNSISVIAVPIMVMLVPILDTTMVTLIRLLSGRKASIGGKDHTSHRLVLMGLSEKSSVLFLYGVGIVSGIAAIFVSRTDTLTSPTVIIPLLLSVVLMGVYLAQLRVYPEKEFSLLREKAYTPILIELTYKRQIVLVALDFCLISFSYYLAYRLRFGGEDFQYYFRVFLQSLPAVIACKFIAFFVLGVYRGMWRYLGANDVFVYLKASLVASLLSIAAVTYIYRFRDFSKGLFLIDWLITTAFVLGTRGSFRFFTDTIKRKTAIGDRVIIYGAGRGGELLLREILNNKALNMKPIGFIDDDTVKNGKNIHGYPILGSVADLGKLHRKHSFKGLLISFHQQDESHMQKAVRYCHAHGIFVKQFSIYLEEVKAEML